GTHTAHITDVMGQRSENGVSPVQRRYDALKPPPAQDVLGAERDQSRVLGIVIKSVAAGDALDDQSGRFVQSRGDLRLPIAEDPAVGLREVSTKCVRQKARRI